MVNFVIVVLLLCAVLLLESSLLHARLKRFKIVQGPLAGVSCSVFRDLIWQYSQPAWVYSEMISCKTILNGSEQIKNRYLHVSEHEGPVCMQIATSDPSECAKACQVLNEMPINMIDLNVGCPVKKIRKRQQGSFLLSDSKRLAMIIQAMRDHTDKAISVKIRVDGGSNQAYNESVLEVVNAKKPDFLVVHGRHHQDGYDVPCDLSQIAFFARHASMPVIGNGDVCDVTSTQNMLDTGCAGAMISRATVGAPWLIAQIQSELGEGRRCISLSQAQRWQVFIKHIHRLAAFLGGEKHALLHAKGLIKYYAKRNGFSKSLLDLVRKVSTLDDLVRIHTF